MESTQELTVKIRPSLDWSEMARQFREAADLLERMNKQSDTSEDQK